MRLPRRACSRRTCSTVLLACLFGIFTFEFLPWFLRGRLTTDLPREISLAEWEPFNSQHLGMGHIQTTSKCSFDVTGGSPLEKVTLSNLTDWSYTRRVNCQKTNFTNYSAQRTGISFFCSRNFSNIYSIKGTAIETIPSVPFGSMCLHDVIKNCCNIKGETIPNVVHYVFCGKQDVAFFTFLSFMSTVRFIKPCMILFHGDTLPSGKYWNYFISIYSNVVHVKRDCLFGGSGHRLGYFEHGTDLMRIETLLIYGGIYIDWDEVVLQPIDKLRKYDYVQGYEQQDEDPIRMGSQFVMAKRNASFLHHWYESYSKDYRRNEWGYNALVIPAKLAKKYPSLIHVPEFYFTRPIHRYLIHYLNYDWSVNYAIHTFQRYYTYRVDEVTIRHLDTTIGSIARHVLFNNKEICR